MILSFLRKITPRFLKSAYHYILGFLGAVLYGHPSHDLIVIGVTGTSGKSTTVYFLLRLLNGLNAKAAAISTIEFSLPSATRLNNKKMTMPGRFAIQKFLRRAVKEGCRYVVLETTSEGIVEWRHKFIKYDVAVLTNLYPEHIEAHHGFENYKAAKLKLFEHVSLRPDKVVAGFSVPRVLIAPGESEYANEFLGFGADLKIAFGVGKGCHLESAEKIFRADNINAGPHGLQFDFCSLSVKTKILGRHNVSNILAACAALVSLGFDLEKIIELLPFLKQPPGRLEFIDEGQPFKVIVDYAFEPRAMEALYDVVAHLPHKRVLHVFGSTGGGRDKARRSVLGKFVGSHAQMVYVTDEDPYDEDPMSIIEEVAKGVLSAGKVEGKNMFKILDRAEAIRRALNDARAGDIVLITGKGCEQAMVVKAGRMVPWDDRGVAIGVLTSG